jgi:hypothetical protein
VQIAEKGSMPHLFTVAEYMKLGLSSRPELLGGVIYDVFPKKESLLRSPQCRWMR